MTSNNTPAFSIKTDDGARIVAFDNEASEDKPRNIVVCGLPGAPERIRMNANQFKTEGDQRPDFWSRSHVAWLGESKDGTWATLSVKPNVPAGETAPSTRLLEVKPREDSDADAADTTE